MLNICKNLFSIWLCAFLGVWGCMPPSVEYNNNSQDDEQLESIVTLVSIEYLKGLYNGNSQLLTQDLAVEGVITANNTYGEFPTSIVIEDSSGAIEIMCDFDSSTAGFLIGTTVRVLCSNLWLGATGGMFSLGYAPEGQSATTSISEEDANLYLQLCDTPIIVPIPTMVTISELSANHILRYVQLDELEFQSTDGSFCTRNPETSLTEYTCHTLQDPLGATITLTVDRNVIYADADIPSGLLSINAIVEYFSGEYMLRITNCGY